MLLRVFSPPKNAKMFATAAKSQADSNFIKINIATCINMASSFIIELTVGFESNMHSNFVFVSKIHKLVLTCGNGISFPC